ncbi:hypothetical protein MO973_39430 [Paenibacillus sp. TRM 82003]|nr:hypothetical protein [Paenibacillus sp. TRM 82003]
MGSTIRRYSGHCRLKDAMPPRFTGLRVFGTARSISICTIDLISFRWLWTPLYNREIYSEIVNNLRASRFFFRGRSPFLYASLFFVSVRLRVEKQ